MFMNVWWAKTHSSSNQDSIAPRIKDVYVGQFHTPPSVLLSIFLSFIGTKEILDFTDAGGEMKEDYNGWKQFLEGKMEISTQDSVCKRSFLG